MKIKLCLFILICTTRVMYSQNQGPVKIDSKPELPKLLPASPTVSGLMKFEEIPVDNYTGVPKVEIPIKTIATRSKELSLEVKLSYHPDLKVNDIASYTGTGWNLIAGGSISRTIRGEDDFASVATTGARIFGIMDPGNPYYGTLVDDAGKLKPNYGLDYNAQKLLFDVFIKGEKYDFEHDLYQYNFMGRTGRFFINKFGQVEHLNNDNPLKIEFDFPNKTFIIYDEKGLKYIFNVHEFSTVNSLTSTGFHLYNYVGSCPFPRYSKIEDNTLYTNAITAFHLREVIDVNLNSLLKFNYQEVPETLTTKTLTKNYLENGNLYLANLQSSWCPNPEGMDYPPDYEHPGCKMGLWNSNVSNFENVTPPIIGQTDTNYLITQKIKSIQIPAQGTLLFSNETGRLDMDNPPQAVRLKNISLYNWSETAPDNIGTKLIDQFELIHQYLGEGNRLVLKSIIQKGSGTTNFLTTKFEYNQIENFPKAYGTINVRDYWGYYNGTTFGELDRKPNQSFLSKGLLNKMILPTGGFIQFEFEPNTYSYIGDKLETTFHNNKLNEIEVIASDTYISNYNYDNNFFYIEDDQFVELSITTSSATSISDINSTSFSLVPVVENQGIPYPLNKYRTFISYLAHPLNIAVSPPNAEPRIGNYIKFDEITPTLAGTTYTYTKKFLLKKGGYAIQFFTNDFTFENISYKLNLKYVRYKTGNDVTKYNIGGGNRIKTISYFENKTTTTASLQKKYNYAFQNSPSQSSGALNFPIPNFWYLMKKNHLVQRPTSLGVMYGQQLADIFVSTDYDTYKSLVTKGSYVGYKNVSVSYVNSTSNATSIPIIGEIQNPGTTFYTYTSPIDFPEDPGSFNVYPSFKPRNYDYKRGNLLEEKVYDYQDNLVQTTTNVFNYIEKQMTTGHAFYTDNGQNCAYASIYPHYERYLNALTNPTYDSGNCGPIYNFIKLTPQVEAFGWARIVSQTITDYFYTSAGTQIVERKNKFTYNAANKMIASKEVISNNSTLRYEYLYDDCVPTHSKNRIGVLKSTIIKRGFDILSQENTVTNAGDCNPIKIQAAKGTNPLENKIFYRFDEFNNLLAVYQENGVLITYIWGYNKTQPIAKIENDVAGSGVETNLQTLSNGTDENALITALNALRSSLPNAMVTTYTYKPLIGVSTVTDPKGLTTTYSYDEFNRLIQVKDHQGNILSENQYNYRPQ